MAKTPRVHIGKSNYHWEHDDVYIQDPVVQEPILNTYPARVFNQLLIDKADKRIPEEEGNLASLTVDGNINDSGLKPPIVITEIDYGIY